jgi:hypothetical protein
MILSDNFKNEYYQMRREIVNTHLNRTDNGSYLTDKLILMIEGLI